VAISPGNVRFPFRSATRIDESCRRAHLRTGDAVRLTSALLAAILGDATNLGAKRMADASAGISERQITWARLFHIRPETYKSALAAIINVHLAIL
jgi:hypothetical protein